jgi:hypothetical protein
MDGSVLDAISGKHYDLETFENELVKVESAGPCIRVGIKNGTGTPFSWWEPRYPFAAPPPGVSWPKQNGWEFTVEAPTQEETRAIFSRGDERHVLTLRVTNPTAHPKPIEVSWE